MGRRNVFVIGLDEMNLAVLRSLPGVHDVEFHGLLGVREVLQADRIELPELLDRAERRLAAFAGRVDAVVGYWDFPVSSMVPLLCRRLGLRGPDLDAVVKCEHKYWSRLEQAKVVEEYPRFAVVDVDRPDLAPPGLRFPMWVKPVKSVASELSYRVEDAQEFTDAVSSIRTGIDRFAEPFGFVLDQLQLPGEVAAVGARACLAEEEVSGRQLTVEGYSLDGVTHVYGIVESVRYPGSSSFLRYQYPARLPATVVERLVDLSRRVVGQLGLRLGTFNIEYFWNPDGDDIRLLEINPRHSQSHALLFGYVDGAPNHHCMVQLALGGDPQMPRGQGRYAVAAKWFVRRFADGLVTRVPTPAEVSDLEGRIPGVRVQVTATPGQRLSQLRRQDSYSYELAAVHVGAGDEAELEEKYERCLAALHFEFVDTAEIHPHRCAVGVAGDEEIA